MDVRFQHWKKGLVWMLFLGIPGLALSVNPNRYEGGRSRDEVASRQRNTSAMARILGEARASISDMMYIKTERYLHSGIHFLVSDQEEAVAEVLSEGRSGDEKDLSNLTGKSDGMEEDHDHDHDHGKQKTLIPGPAEDFRRFIGYLHRQVKPWQDPNKAHGHTDGKELLPWFRVMTISDPHYVRGYALGAFWLSQYNLDEAIEFIEEGLKNNPKAFRLHYTYGDLCMKKARVLGGGYDRSLVTSEVAEWYERARIAFGEAVRFLVEVRPSEEDRKKNPFIWSDYEEAEARAAIRMFVLLEDLIGEHSNAMSMAHQLKEYLKGDPILEGFLEKNGG